MQEMLRSRITRSVAKARSSSVRTASAICNCSPMSFPRSAETQPEIAVTQRMTAERRYLVKMLRTSAGRYRFAVNMLKVRYVPILVLLRGGGCGVAMCCGRSRAISPSFRISTDRLRHYTLAHKARVIFGVDTERTGSVQWTAEKKMNTWKYRSTSLLEGMQVQVWLSLGQHVICPRPPPPESPRSSPPAPDR